MAYITPIPSAAPPGSVLDTAVDDSAMTNACGTVRPGIVTTMTKQYVSKFQTAKATSVTTVGQVIARIVDQMPEMSANCGRKYQNTATITATETSAESARLGPSRRRVAASAAGPGPSGTVSALRRVGRA